MKTKTQIAALGAVAALLLAGASAAQAQVKITEVSAWGSGSSPYATDWFELTNTGTSAVSLAGWQMDDSSNGSGKVAMVGISSIAAGESVIFTENAAKASFLSTWFGSNAPANLQIGTYTGGGVGLSTSGDAVNVYNASGVSQANVIFGNSPGGPFATFDNAAGLTGNISQLSVVGVNGAFAALNDSSEIGSPGSIAAAVPEPASYALILAGLLVVGSISRRRNGKA
ncbi:MAG TPA: lamin tail domain-containing protein [Burkholderiaceae bacterium]|jgi:hypothetical protein